MKQFLLNLLLRLARKYLIFNEETEDFETRDKYNKQCDDIARQIFIDRMTEHYDKALEREKETLRNIYDMPYLTLEDGTQRMLDYARALRGIFREQAQTASTPTTIESDTTD